MIGSIETSELFNWLSYQIKPSDGLSHEVGGGHSVGDFPILIWNGAEQNGFFLVGVVEVQDCRHVSAPVEKLIV